MSAYIVNDDLIDLLVTYATGGGPMRVSNEDPQTLGQMLVNENYRSVNCRYRETTEAPEYHFMVYTGSMRPVDVLSACAEYDYQSCETEDYRETPAARLISGIKSKAIRALTGYGDTRASNPNRKAGGTAVLLSQLARRK